LIDNLEVRLELIEKDIITNCINYTKLIISQVSPENAYLVIDGVAPRSKMNQQRERRYKSEFLRKPDEIPLWDSNNITPGTKFMDKLIQELKKLKDIILSDSNEPGEGEHKIMKIIEQKMLTGKVMIYGLDADLIFLSILHKFSDNIILVRDNSFNNTLSDDKKVIDFINIKNLKSYIYNDFLGVLQQTKYDKEVNSIIKNRLIDDYVFLCFFLGNDFLEHLPSVYIKKNGIDTLMKAYSNAYKGEYLIIFSENKKQIINTIFLRDIMYQLRNHESYFFKNYNSEFFTESALTNVIEQDEKVCFYEDSALLNLKTKNYKQKYNIYYGIKTNELKDVCLNYIEGLLWVFYYYKGHVHQNWSWFYRYHNSPFCSDLFDFVKNNPILIDNLDFKKDKPFSPIKQLCLVLPKKSLLYILKELDYCNDHPLILFVNNKNVNKYYPEKLFIDIINKRYLWQSKIFFENIDDNIIDLHLN
jgi:5'-3' exoribonuclease 1